MKAHSFKPSSHRWSNEPEDRAPGQTRSMERRHTAARILRDDEPIHPETDHHRPHRSGRILRDINDHHDRLVMRRAIREDDMRREEAAGRVLLRGYRP